MAVPYSYADLTALLAIDVTTLTDGSPRLVKNVGWFQYDATATTGGYAPAVGAGRWFPLVGGSGVGIAAQIKTTDFTADSFGEYIINSATAITLSYPASPTAGTPFSFLAINAGQINSAYAITINSLYRVDTYFAKDKWVKLVYVNSTIGWVCPTTDVFNGLLHGLDAFWSFDTGTGSLVDSISARNFTDTGTTPIAYTTGIIGAHALNFDNAVADYQLSQSDVNLSPTTKPFTDTLGFAFLVNLTSGTQPILSQKWTSDATKYTYCVRAIDATHIQFSIETGGTGAGLFTAIATVAAAYGVPLLIVVTMPVAYTVKSPRVMELQVNNGAIISTVITGDYQTSNPLIVGQSEAGSQIVGVIDQIRSYNWEIDSNQRTLLYNNGAFV